MGILEQFEATVHAAAEHIKNLTKQRDDHKGSMQAMTAKLLEVLPDEAKPSNPLIARPSPAPAIGGLGPMAVDPINRA